MDGLKLLLSSCLGLVVVGHALFFFFSQNDFALTSTEKSIQKESETKETRGEEEQDTEVLEVFQPTQEWQALQPGTRPALVL